MTDTTKSRALNRAGLVHVKGWIHKADLDAFASMEARACGAVAAAENAPKRTRGRPRKEKLK